MKANKTKHHYHHQSWPKERLLELAEMIDLVVIVSRINKGDKFIDKMQFCIMMAEKLTALDLENARPSFLQYLSSRAAGE